MKNTPEQEREFYDQCSAFFHNHHTPSAGMQLTHIITTLAENDEGIGVNIAVIDPGIPEECTAIEKFDLPVARHAATLLQEPINEALESTITSTMKMYALRDLIGADTFLNALKESESADEFKTALESAGVPIPKGEDNVQS